MTLWARRSEHNPKNIEVSGTSGSITVTVTEHQDHIKRFWSDLGDLLREEEKTAGAEESHGG